MASSSGIMKISRGIIPSLNARPLSLSSATRGNLFAFKAPRFFSTEMSVEDKIKV
jgi:hypothetical protein